MPDDLKWTSRWWAVLLRVFLGAMWLYAASEKMNPSFGGIRGIVRVMALGDASHPQGNPIEPFRQFLLDYVLPNWQIFGVMVLLGELFVGFTLFMGLGTRLAALIGIFLQLNYWLGRGYLEWPLTYPAIIIPHIVVIWTHAGRTLGLDAWLSKRWPKWPLW